MSERQTTPRVVITGIGAVSAYGWGVSALEQGLRSGQTGISECQYLETRGHRTTIAGEVPQSPARLAGSASDPCRGAQLSRADRFALAAAQEAWAQAGMRPDPAGRARAGLYFGGSTAGMAECEEYIARWLGLRSERARLSLLVSQQNNGPGDAVARHLGLMGPVQTVSSACASGALAIAAALGALRANEVDVALAGGADALCQLTYGGFNALRSVDERPCRPFRADRAGLSIGEGAAVLVLERLDHALARGATPLAELLGAGASCDAYHMTAPHPEGSGAAAAIRSALDDAGLEPHAETSEGLGISDGTAARVGMINAHGTGTPLNDLAESRALRAVFGAATDSIPVTASKAAIGHLLGCSGAIEAVATVCCLIRDEVFVTPGSDAADDDLAVDLVVGEARRLEPGTVAVSTSLAFGGANAALVLAGWTEP